MPSTDETWEWAAFDIEDGEVDEPEWRKFNPTMTFQSLRTDMSWTRVIDEPEVVIYYQHEDSWFRILFIRKVRDA